MKQLKELRDLINGLEEHVERNDGLLAKFERQEDCLHHASLAAQLPRGAYVRFRLPSAPEGTEGVFVEFDENCRAKIMYWDREDKSLELAHIPPASLIFEG